MTNPTFPVHIADQSYDIQNFLHDHPGGVNTLKYYQGKSILEAMTKFGHSSSAFHMLRDFKVEKGGVSKNGRILTNEASRDETEIEFLEELEGKLDWSQPILNQLHKISPHYHLWVNTAVHRQCRLFASPVLETLTLTPWYVVPLVWVPIILGLGWRQWLVHVGCQDSCPDTALTHVQYLTHIAAGGVIWTFLEYSLHRWVFHLDPGASLTMIRIHFLIHGMHHKVPFDGLRQVFPPIPALLITGILYVPVRMLLNYPLIKFTGGLIGYLTYDMLHYYAHHGSPAAGSYLYTMKRYHSNHHFVNHDKAFGISTNVWDVVFRTFVHVRKLGFSLHW